MATYFSVFAPGQQFADDNGDPYSAGKLYIYDAGTTTARTSYKDNGGAVAHASPIVLDAAGRIPSGDNAWVLTGAVKVNLTDSADTQATGFPEDNIVPSGDSAASVGTEWVVYTPAPTQTGATTFTLVGDQTDAFHVGRRLKISDSTTLYGTITVSAYTSLTTVTVVIDDGTALTSTMDAASAVSYGLVSYANTSAPSHTFVHVEATGANSISAEDTPERLTSITTGTINRGTYWDTVNSWFETPFTGQYLIKIVTLTTSIVADSFVRHYLYSDTDPAFGSPSVLHTFQPWYKGGTSSTARFENTHVVTLTAGDVVAVYGEADDFTSGTSGTFTTTVQITALYRG